MPRNSVPPRTAAPPRSGCRGRAVAVVDAFPLWAAHGGGAVRIEGDCPVPLVYHDQVVEGAEQDQLGQFGAAAFAAGGGVVHVAAGGWLVAAGGGAVPVAQDDGAAQVGRDGVGAGAEVDREADGGGRAGQRPGAQERGELAGSGEQGDGVSEDEAADRFAVRRGGACAGELGGELVEEVVVDAAGDDRHDGGVAGVCWCGSWPEGLGVVAGFGGGARG